MDTKLLKWLTLCLFLSLSQSCDKPMGIYFQVNVRNELNEVVYVTYGRGFSKSKIKRVTVAPNQLLELEKTTGYNFNGWGREKNILLVFRYIMDTLSVTSSLGTSENLTWKDYRMKPNDTLFEFTPIPSNEEKGTAIYTLVIDSAIYR